MYIDCSFLLEHNNKFTLILLPMLYKKYNKYYNKNICWN